MYKTRYIQKSAKLTLIAILGISCMVVLTSTVSSVDAAPKHSRYSSGSSCTENKDKNGNYISTTCCWRERVPGKILGQQYCQTCTGSTCGDVEIQMLVADQTNTVNPTINNDIKSENPTTQPASPSSDRGAIIDEKLTDQELKQTPTFNQGETLSNSENLDNTFAGQEAADSTSIVPLTASINVGPNVSPLSSLTLMTGVSAV